MRNLFLNLRSLYQLFDKRLKLQLFFLVLISTLTAFCEVFSLGALVSAFQVADNTDLQMFEPFLNLVGLEASRFNFIIIFSLAVLFSTSLRLGTSATSAIITKNFSTSVSLRLFDSLIASGIERNSKSRTDDFFSAVIGKIAIVANGCVFSLSVFLSGSIICIFIGSFLVMQFSVFTILPVLMLIAVLILLSISVKKTVTKNSERINSSYSTLAKQLRETNNSLIEVTIYKKLNILKDEFTASQNSMNSAKSTNQIISQLPRFVLESIAVLILLFVLIWLYPENFIELSQDLIAIIGVVGFILYRLMPIFQQIQTAIVTFMGNVSLVSEIKDLVDVGSSQTQKLFVHNPNNNFNRNTKYVFELENICFRYGKKFLLENTSIKIPTNSFVALFGPSGSGKSTLLKILIGLLSPNSGQIKFFGKIINSDNKMILMDNIAYVPQSVQIFNDTLLYNITLNRKPSLEEIKRAVNSLKKAKVQVKEIFGSVAIEDIKLDYEGNNLSGGQKQRIGLARALFQDRPIILLDEVTASLDNEVEKKLLDTLSDLCKNKRSPKTIVFATHSFNALRKVDKSFKIKKK